MNAPIDIQGLARSIFDAVPFLRLLGIEVVSASPEKVVASLAAREDLVGNPHQQILHGGVISAVMDSVGGLVAILKYMSTLDVDGDPEAYMKALERVAKFATIDMRADYLSPGRGTRFVCEGTILRLGRHVVVSRMEFRNEENALVAVGTGTYNY